MGFWDSETCEHCGGSIEEQLVTIHRQVADRYVIVEDVPAGVCTQCGARFFSANVLKSVEVAIGGRVAPLREVAVPIYSLAQ
jgi:YgiT-type zinc finger domain-containing protein